MHHDICAAKQHGEGTQGVTSVPASGAYRLPAAHGFARHRFGLQRVGMRLLQAFACLLLAALGLLLPVILEFFRGYLLRVVQG